MIISLPGCDFKYCKFNSNGNCLERNKNDGCTYRRLKENVDNNWISVKDRLPTWKDGKVLIYTCYGISVAEKTVNGKWQGKHATPKNITHWMPLPEPPEMEGATNNG